MSTEKPSTDQPRLSVQCHRNPNHRFTTHTGAPSNSSFRRTTFCPRAPPSSAKKLFAIICGCELALLLTACDPTAGDRAPGIPIPFRHPWGVPGRSQNSDCLTVRALRASPSASEYPIFLSRLDLKSGVVIRPINAACLDALFSVNDLSAWEQRGDPVAGFLLLRRRYPRMAAICHNFPAILSKLSRYYRVEVSIPLRSAPVHRVPELWYTSRFLGAACQRGQLVTLAPADAVYGYYPRPPNGYGAPHG